ncbi:glycerol-3-phosphate dehydrogenase/oxidase [Planomonospora venezuelensis]|uniref:Glycerol-3-phosphate dehydrogenase n=1 Tax=Planomonospora venezuelensis TaxID=1999 RepID=A0A841D7P2_PLAVE|nr:glycerol-3-phosphate dehydrogenase/oxidase [Planomonospora venezuelensis]MBB5964358.1 glycerol-3-phosphate dehydrogenase [Planomonospora venezuelensis]GIN05106.1 glycerol-3-phosphate dehydrogenase [Planomonospora venezuelensis]
MRSSLNAARRSRELAELAGGPTVDVLVVGLGATGAGAALDAASRGLSVAAVDAHDLAFGTSRWSSKMIHGGLRYLAKGQVGVARESAVERGVLLRRTAPHLVRAQPYLLPLTPEVSAARAALVMAGYRLGDGLRAAARTPRRLLPGPSRISASRALELAAPLSPRGLRGALLSWDGRLVDDARLVVALARTAAAQGARILTRCRALELTGDGALVRDELTGEAFTVRAKAVINAAGVWAARLDPAILLRPSRGTHLVLGPHSLPGLRAGLHLPIPGEGNRFALVLPQADGRVYVGLTDEPVDGPVPDVPEAPEEDVAFLLGVLNSVLGTAVRREDVAGTFAGLRPLLAAAGRAGERTADLSRKHALLTSADGVVTVVGGKLTTYRRMAEDAVDLAVRLRGLDAGGSRTARLPLVGVLHPGVEAPARLVERYGSEAPAVHALALSDPALAETLPTGVTVAELVWAVRHEGALDAADLLDRRTRIGLVPRDREAALPAAEAALAHDG